MDPLFAMFLAVVGSVVLVVAALAVRELLLAGVVWIATRFKR